MNVVFLSPQFPPQFYLFCTALKRQGVNVLGIGDAPAFELRPELSGALTEYAFVPDMNDYEAMLRTVAGFVSRHGKIDRIDSLNEYWLALEARLRDDFNIWGPRSDQMARHRSKMGMREIFRSAGVPCTEGIRVTSHDDVRAFAARVGFPLVFKPEVGVGAAFTFRVNTEEGMEQALKHPLNGYVVERFVEGELTSFDGLVDRFGHIAFWTSHVYSSGVMDIVNMGLDVYYYSRREIPKELEELGRKTVAAFEIRERFFHIEFFHEPDGKFRALEINIRPPGGFTTDMMNYSSDVDIYSLWAQAITGEDLSGFRFQRRYHAAHASRRHGRHYALPHERLLQELGSTVVLTREIPPVLSGAMGNVLYLLRHPEQPAILEAIGKVIRA